jgi:hypothetical protein
MNANKQPEDVPIKRKPGRPRKKMLKEPQKRQGILEKPSSDKHVVELLYDKPSNFNKICKYWKSLNTDKIKFVFTPAGLVLYTKNYKGTNHVGIKCDGALMNQYFAKETIMIGVSFANIEPILNKLDKSYETICFVIKERTKNKTLHIVLQNDVNIPESFDIEIFIDEDIGQPLPADLFDGNLGLGGDEKVGPRLFTPYQLEFRLPGKYFKKMISDTKQFDKQWTIEKYGDANLMFSYKLSNGQVKATIIPSKAADIGLKSLVTPNEIFSVSIYVDTIKPTSSSQLAEVIQIKASKDRALCIWADLDDKAVVVNTLVDIVDHRAPAAK